MARGGEATQLYVTLPARETAWAGDALRAALAFPEVSAVMLEVDQSCQERRTEIAALVELCQKQGRAVLLTSDAAFVHEVGADGVHVPAGPDLKARYQDARSILGPDASVGIDAGRSRHDAMTLGELGADYVAFGIPAHVEDRQRAGERRRDLVAWWSEIFQVPCVASNVESVCEAAELVRSGADFLEIAIPAGHPPDGIASYLEGFAAATRETCGQRACDVPAPGQPGDDAIEWEKAR